MALVRGAARWRLPNRTLLPCHEALLGVVLRESLDAVRVLGRLRLSYVFDVMYAAIMEPRTPHESIVAHSRTTTTTSPYAAPAPASSRVWLSDTL